jgi:hypothetical protein
MPLAVPADEAITQEVATRLAGISGVTIVRYRREVDHWTPIDNQIVIIKRTPERLPELDYPGNPPAQAWRLPLALKLHIQQSERDTDSGDELISVAIANCMEEIQGAANWYQWDSLAVNTEFGNIELGVTGTFDVATIPLLITYRISEGDPYTVR